MKIFLALLLTMTGFASFCQSNVVVTNVIDGDTYKVLLNGKIEKIRLRNIDAPEVKQYFGATIRDSVTALLQKRTITLKLYGSDLYGRYLADISINGKSLDSVIIAKGWAWSYTKYSHNLQLNIYEAAARKKGLGMWKCEFNIPPWTWRKLSKRNKRLYEVCR